VLTSASQCRSVWEDDAAILSLPPLVSSTSADVCVVGAGVAGLTTAYLAAREGTDVVLVDRSGIGSGETSRTTAHLSNVLDHPYSEVERDLGPRGVRLAADSHAVAIDVIEAIARDERIACDFLRVDGYLLALPNESHDRLDREFAAAERAGLQHVEWVPEAPLRSVATGPCLRFRNQAQFHPLKYLAGLSAALLKRRGRIYCGTTVSRIDGRSVLTAGGLTISAQSIVVATNTPIHENLLVHVKQSPYRTYVIAAEIPRGSVPMALYWDTADPFHYVRLQTGSPGRDLLIAGGEDHRTGDDDDGAERFDALESWTRARFPIGRVTHRWSGQVMQSADGVGLIGHDIVDRPGVYLCTGDSGQGITHGTIAGLLITDLIRGRENPWRQLYDPARLPLQSSDFYQSGIDVLWHYAEWLTSGDVGTRGAINRSSGAVIREGLSKIAVYRDDAGQTVEMSAVCPHLGCLVHWNSIEKEWECPCHGSRFDRHGGNLNGPAASPLARIHRPR